MSIFLLTILISVAHSHGGIDHSKEINRELEQEVKIDFSPVVKIFNKSCVHCHSQKSDLLGFYTKLPVLDLFFEQRKVEAQSHIDFTHGYPPKGHGSLRDDLIAIHRSLARETMPPPLWNWWHKDYALADSDRKLLMQWIENQLNRLSP